VKLLEWTTYSKARRNTQGKVEMTKYEKVNGLLSILVSSQINNIICATRILPYPVEHDFTQYGSIYTSIRETNTLIRNVDNNNSRVPILCSSIDVKNTNPIKITKKYKKE
jgi:hypothetical protein